MRLTKALPQTGERIHSLYYQKGETQAGNRLLPKELRFKILKQVRDLAEAQGISFGVCREGLAELNTAPCDGSWLLPKPKEAPQCRLA
jgi:sulfur relay (sulfurtransferase) complex TusBCD TusD component (DsrE family)